MSDINKILEFYNNYEKEKGNWDVRYLINSESPPANANILGLEIIDERDMVADMQQYARERWKERKEKYKYL